MAVETCAAGDPIWVETVREFSALSGVRRQFLLCAYGVYIVLCIASGIITYFVRQYVCVLCWNTMCLLRSSLPGKLMFRILNFLTDPTFPKHNYLHATSS